MTVTGSPFICGKCNKRMNTSVLPEGGSNILALYMCPKCGYFIINKPEKVKKISVPKGQ
jgi:predicted RNA-binding Zn-ribbon protein involved in translation (DUF1610 family)